MTKTIADMTAEERAECVGMWAWVENTHLAVITEADHLATCAVMCPSRQGGYINVHKNEGVTPLYDLPRAWTPDGQPELAQALAEETWEYQVQTRSQKMPTWLAITDDTLQKWYPEGKYKNLIRSKQGSGWVEVRALRRRVSPPEVIND